ncbi:MAG: ankyrin repeat domain-containing protein [Bacteroidales bacterium]|jgi:ankyrin repeat protein|nr:ankyrin repeat domain-containing protein [Bacteroidales bacterium]
MRRKTIFLIWMSLSMSFILNAQIDKTYDDNQGDLSIRKVLILPSLPEFEDTVSMIVRGYMKEKMLANSDARIFFYISEDFKFTPCPDLSYLDLTDAEFEEINGLYSETSGLRDYSSRFDPPGREDFDTAIYAEIGRTCRVDAILVGTLYNYKMGQTFSTTMQMDVTPELKTKGWVCFSLIDAKTGRILWMDTGKHKEVAQMNLVSSSMYYNYYKGNFPSLAGIVCGAFDDIASKFPYKNRILTREETALFNLVRSETESDTYKEQIRSNKQFINAKDENGNTFLHFAAISGDTKLIQFLLDEGALVNAKNNKGYTPLATAVKEQKYTAARLLLESGADVNATDIFNYTPIFYAIDNNDLQMMKLMKENGADINFKDMKSRTPLTYSANIDSKTALTEYLLDNGADLNLTSCYGWTPFFYSCFNGSSRNADILYKSGSAVDLSDVDGETPLFCAVINNHTDIARFLLERQADINHQNLAGMTPVMIALDSSYSDLSLYLISQQDLKVNITDTAGYTALFYAVRSGKSNLLEQLLKRGADPNIADRSGATPLLYGCAAENTQMVNLLLDYHANPDISTSDSLTPLIAAILLKSLPVTKALLDHGADPDGIFPGDLTPLMYAATDGSSEIVACLVPRVKDINATCEGETALMMAVNSLYAESVRYIVDDPKTDYNITNDEGMTALMLAIDLSAYYIYRNTDRDYFEVSQSQDQIIDLLLNEDFDVSLRNNNDETALMLASENYDQMESVKKLIAKGSEINAIDSRGYTAYDHAKKLGYRCGKIAKYLKKNGGLPGKKLAKAR